MDIDDFLAQRAAEIEREARVRNTNARAAVGMLLLSFVLLGIALGIDQPIFALAAVIFLSAAILVSRYA